MVGVCCIQIIQRDIVCKKKKILRTQSAIMSCP